MPAFVALSALWGSSFALIKIGVDAGVSPMWVALWRCLFGAVTLLVVCAVQRLPLPRDKATWGHALVVAALLNAAPFALFAYGEQYVDSVLAGIFNATTPLLTLVFVLLMVNDERLTGRRVAGLGLGFLGVLVVLGVWNGLVGGTLVGGLACLAATACYGAGFAYTRRFFSQRPGSVTALSAVQIGCATLELGVVTAAAGLAPTWPGWYAAIALLVLGALGTGLAYILNLRIIRDAGPTVASTVTYVVPLWSTLIGAVLLSEPLSWNTFVGAAMVIAGILVSRTRSGRREKVDAAAGSR
ncbi:drug/metabolite transporter (DMT)-like permease [Saccharothrix tamanrassetensis]|uniref:Drug/metabolite transporter (DMT)-like permease n=1 Tax=Saccharothrix tamanrassetensis TaxID=1051531 RepID=A0A841C8V8_9PSEU|nr:DMT family transporter [Saccharothrix tamanrassetensis]MBB5953849.1 drug/metabolite transporter (DMT)-like permease [Saccharothrix tamanrassetensis]